MSILVIWNELRTLANFDSFHFGPHCSIDLSNEKVQVGKDQEKAQSEKDSHSKNRGGKNQTNNQVLIP